MSVAVRAWLPSRLPLLLLGAAFVLISFGAAVGHVRLAGAGAAFLLIVTGAIAKPVIQWRSLVAVLLLIVLFIPIRRYLLAGSLPFQLEPYRLYIMLIVGGWILALLADPRVRVTRTGFEKPLFLLVVVILLSEVTNPTRVNGLASPVLKTTTFLVSFLIVVYLIVSVIRTFADVERMVRILVLGGSVISVAAIVEARTGFNPFDHLHALLPFLHPVSSGVDLGLSRSGHNRVLGPAQHPIALGAALTMLVPLAIYLAVTSRQYKWILAAVLLLLGSLATLSRTTVVMLVVIVLFLLWLRPQVLRRMWPALIPILVATHLLLPGTLGTFQAYFFPSGGIISNQLVTHVPIDKSNPTWCDSEPRLGRIGPMLALVGQKPIVGWGYGTRLTGSDPNANTCVLDDEWLGTLVETGTAGVVAWWWLILTFVGRSGRIARREDSKRGWLLAALASAVLAFSFGMFLFDAFSFIQVTFFFFIFIALGAVLLRDDTLGASPPMPAAATLSTG